MIDFSAEIYYQTARSGGKGGQNVNKVETMVTAHWKVRQSGFFDKVQQERILEKLKNRINKEGELIVKSQQERSQLSNKQKARALMLLLVNQGIIAQKRRIKTLPGKAVKEKRLNAKRILAEKKMHRRKDW